MQNTHENLKNFAKKLVKLFQKRQKILNLGILHEIDKKMYASVALPIESNQPLVPDYYYTPKIVETIRY